VFGDDWFALEAEAFVGTSTFLVAQTMIVGVRILINIAGWCVFNQYAFILLNFAFSLQAAYMPALTMRSTNSLAVWGQLRVLFQVAGPVTLRGHVPKALPASAAYGNAGCCFCSADAKLAY
jgi:hypothetical protein